LTTADFLYLALLAAVLAVDHFVLWRGFLGRFPADPGGARRWIFSRWTGMLWTLGVALLALWIVQERSWAAIRLVLPHGWRLWVAIGLVLSFAAVSVRPFIRVAKAKRPIKVKVGNPSMQKVMPRGNTEIGWWTAVSISAGFFEELVFRGYLIWAFQPFLGLWGAAALSALVFALGHSYQGMQGIVSTGVGAVVFTLIVLALGSLWPAIVVHAMLDLSQGWLAWFAVRGAEDEPAVA
jgi:membrane protease YdiL (CAAX protease family)